LLETGLLSPELDAAPNALAFPNGLAAAVLLVVEPNVDCDPLEVEAVLPNVDVVPKVVPPTVEPNGLGVEIDDGVPKAAGFEVATSVGDFVAVEDVVKLEEFGPLPNCFFTLIVFFKYPCTSLMGSLYLVKSFVNNSDSLPLYFSNVESTEVTFSGLCSL